MAEGSQGGEHSQVSKGFIYAEVEITNPTEFEKYRPLAEASLAPFGGRFVVRQRDPQVLEGDRHVRLVVVLEFDSPERAMEWYNSDQYQAAKAIRIRAANAHVVLVNGYNG